MINLFANDGQRIYEVASFGPFIIGDPFVAAIGTGYTIWLLGPHAALGMLVFVLFYPVQYSVSKLTGYFRRRTLTATDQRVRLMNELLNCIKLIKMYAWEKPFAKSIKSKSIIQNVLFPLITDGVIVSQISEKKRKASSRQRPMYSLLVSPSRQSCL